MPAWANEQMDANVGVAYAALVEDFMMLFGQLPVDSSAPIITDEVIDLRIRLIEEEVNRELLPALQQLKTARSLERYTEVLDAICDTLYVVIGAALALDLPLHSGFLEVHRSNMAKLGADGKPIRREDGKILKPEGWQPPRLFELVAAYKQLRSGVTYSATGIREGA